MCITALIGAAAIGGIASLAGGAMQADAANKAAAAQEKGTLAAIEAQKEATAQSLALQQQGLDFQKQQAEQARADAMPWLVSGEQALFKYYDELGISRPEQSSFGADVALTPGAGFQQTPGYQYQLQEGEKALENSLAQMGLKNSGSALKALTRFRQGLADSTYDNYLTRLAGAAAGGQQQQQATNSLAASSAGVMSNTLANMGNTAFSGGANIAGLNQNLGTIQGSSYVGQGNAWSNALGNLSNNVGNALGQYAYTSQQVAPRIYMG